MSVTEQAVSTLIQGFVDPNTGKALGAKALQAQALQDGRLTVTVAVGYPVNSLGAAVVDGLAAELGAVVGVTTVEVKVVAKVKAHAVQAGLNPIRGIRNVIAVASGKGGVGKSTTAVNLALALQAEGARVGMLDADIYGPSQPTMLGIQGHPESHEDGESMRPLMGHGLQTMSVGFLIDPDQPMVWRGPMVTQALEQLLRDTHWEDLDYLIVDMPPGTGDVQLTLAQKVPVTGAVIVTTPQDIALLDARKGFKMFEKVGVPILGVVENMSTHRCSQCGHEEPIFGQGGAARMCIDFGTELIGALPLDIRIREQTDSGTPTVIADPSSTLAQTYRKIAQRVAIKVAQRGENPSVKFPKIVVQNT
ncbi:MAG: iron-sulfur cluster carrier protein ApbC [Ferrovum sp.]|nr:iron-sulfur cluster carrier protein ApbC [Ferrovum sp.]NDU87755.1 iron-sulfur cluster carrier protein ApbC [Ferrovum sp.]